MICLWRYFRGLALWLAAACCLQLCAADFALPAEGPVPFRRDRIPLDAEAMAGLSKQLEILALSLNPGSSSERRGAAQMLALALALDPGNPDARRLLGRYHDGRHRPAPDGKLHERARARTWQAIAWLETPEAGTDGQSLSACLKDVMVLADPGHPRSETLRQSGERGAWKGWIPPLAAFEKKSGPNETASAGDGFQEPDIPSGQPPAVPDTAPEGGIRLATAEVRTPLWLRETLGDTSSWRLAPAPLQMTAKLLQPEGEDGGTPPFSIRIGSIEVSERFHSSAEMLRELLDAHHKELPSGIRVTITSPEFERSLASGRRQAITAAAAVLGSAAITGREPGAIILGQIDGEGTLKLPSGFWDQIYSLGKGSGQRLVLPAAAAPLLPSLLALEKPEFFMEYEVLLAENLEQLLALSAKSPDPEVAALQARFGEIREKAGNQDVRLYIANRFIRQRLSDLAQEMPAHFSARMLSVQAAGNRPTTVAREALAAELLRSIRPMAVLAGLEDWEVNVAQNPRYARVYDECRAAMDPLERYAEKTDVELITRTRDLTLLLRNLDRATRARGESYIVEEGVRRAYRDFSRGYKSLTAMLAVETGQVPTSASP